MQSKTNSKTWARFNKSLRLFNSLFLAILSFWQLWWAKRRLFASQKREDNASKWGHLYRPCTSVALSNCVTGSVNNSRQTKIEKSGCQLSLCWWLFALVNRTNVYCRYLVVLSPISNKRQGKEKVKVSFWCKNEAKIAFLTLFKMASCRYLQEKL